MSVSHFFSHYPTIEYKKAALYVRCSKEEQAKFGDTIEAQTEDLKEFARQHHLQVVDIYVDEGHTARKKYNKRKEFVRMLHDVELHKLLPDGKTQVKESRYVSFLTYKGYSF